MAHVHFEMCYVLLKAASDLTTCLCECERPIDGEQYLRMQTSEAPASGVCDGAEVADKGTVCVLSHSARVKLYPTLSSVHNVNAKFRGGVHAVWLSQV